MDKIRVTNITNVAGLDISNNDDLPFLNTLNSAFSLLLPRSVTDFGRLVFTFSRLKASTDINRSPRSGVLH